MRYTWICALLCLVGIAAWTRSRPADIPFEKHTIDLGANEACAWADMNGDGKLDIVSGENWYEAPKWIKHKFRRPPLHQQLHRRFQRSSDRRQRRWPDRHRELLVVQQATGVVAESGQGQRRVEGAPVRQRPVHRVRVSGGHPQRRQAAAGAAAVWRGQGDRVVRDQERRVRQARGRQRHGARHRRGRRE